MQLRVRALESILLEKGYIKPAAIDELIETYEKRLDPETAPMSWRRHGSIPRFRQWLLVDGTIAAITYSTICVLIGADCAQAGCPDGAAKHRTG